MLARKLYKSLFCKYSPHIREIFIWLLQRANHKTNGDIQRGQCFCTYKEIQDGLAWHIGYRRQTYKRHHIQAAMRVLMKEHMVHTKRSTRGMLITICNYDIYQDPKNYESYTKPITDPRSIHRINKNVKNEKKDKDSFSHNLQKYIACNYSHICKMKKQITEDECIYLESNFSPDQIKEKLDAMENYVPLSDKYVSVGKTLKTWLEKDYES